MDVGCYEAPLRDFLPKGVYTGVDMAGNPDIVINLDSGDDLPFPDEAYETVISIETLEHLENVHQIFHEICRVSGKYIIISLPN